MCSLSQAKIFFKLKFVLEEIRWWTVDLLALQRSSVVYINKCHLHITIKKDLCMFLQYFSLNYFVWIIRLAGYKGFSKIFYCLYDREEEE